MGTVILYTQSCADSFRRDFHANYFETPRGKVRYLGPECLTSWFRDFTVGGLADLFKTERYFAKCRVVLTNISKSIWKCATSGKPPVFARIKKPRGVTWFLLTKSSKRVDLESASRRKSRSNLVLTCLHFLADHAVVDVGQLSAMVPPVSDVMIT